MNKFLEGLPIGQVFFRTRQEAAKVAQNEAAPTSKARKRISMMFYAFLVRQYVLGDGDQEAKRRKRVLDAIERKKKEKETEKST